MVTSKFTVAQVAEMLKEPIVSDDLMAAIENDPRRSVIKLLAAWRARRDKAAKESQRLQDLYKLENEWRSRGCRLIAGMDEAGRGPLAGPVMIGCVILPPDCCLPYLNDSKKLTPAQREALYEQIRGIAVAVSSVAVDVATIDRLNIYQATRYGMYQAVERLSQIPDAVLIDAVPLPELAIPSQSIIGGDALSASIAAASIIAKVERDRLMDELSEHYPEYGFAQHKGYATPEHLRAIRQYGPCPLHRTSFEPIKSWGRSG